MDGDRDAWKMMGNRKGLNGAQVSFFRLIFVQKVNGT